MVINVVLVIIGFLLLIKGAEWLVDGASSLAKKYGVSDLAIGLTIVAFGTSAPELVVNSVASYDGHSDIVFGNVIGSNNFNLFAILGIVGLIYPITVQNSTAWKEIPISLIAVVLLFLLANNIFTNDPPDISRLDSLLLMTCFILFLYYVYHQLKTKPTETALHPVIESSNLKISALLFFGLQGLIFGGRFVVDNAIDIAHALDVSEKIIGLTIIAAGTSLPELFTSVVAAIKKNSDIAIGNIIGSNIFNIFLILSVSGLIRPISYNSAFNSNLYLLGCGTCWLIIAMVSGRRKTIDRWEALILLLTFVIYTGYLIWKEI